MRADAARNHERILQVAGRLFAERGVEHVTMDEIAAAANVGKGTLYRRFGDRANLAVALLNADQSAFQEAFVRGAPPLGPGAPPRERLSAFFAALSDHIREYGELIAEAERSVPAGERFTWGVYTAWHAHVRMLLAELDPPLDADVLAHVLLAPLRPDAHRDITAGSDRRRLLGAIDVLLDGLDRRRR
ncbi:TetR/AcrR family transcriptional regulator [Solirubrobacter phytolaccae]|uniref:TetR/AcrR family transcriptional regulator n=1 Tax=Solirubrobacter phytolaccae TaxID=1404360 RepID=A0A9X3SHR3_9ACTN|nr:TetR/AcrR family transcriptional regulator [Solirubrobacter phytolaccae]MDA0183407.1 TetR/AcrR family transcriptional regulator [Solirubrobacter phytolaccae]